MLDPSLPWLAVGYRNFKQEDFCQRQIRDEMSKYRIDTTDVRSVLRSSTPQGQQRRRVKSATATRFTSRSCDSFTARPTPRPKSAQSYHPNYPHYQDADRSPVSRQRRPRSAFLPHHRPSPAQNRSVTAVERQYHLEKTIKLCVDERDSKCAFCPVECRPKSSSSNRPTSSTGLVAAHVPSHYDRYVAWTRPRTAPATRREFLQLPRHNNIRRGSIPRYTNFVKRVELGLRDGTPSPPPRRRIAFEDESAKRQSPSLEESSDADEEDGELVLSEEDNIDEELEEDVSIRIPTPIEPPLEYEPEEPPTDEGQEAWTEPKAPTPSPALSGRNSPEPELPETTHMEPEAPSPREPTPPPREPTPPPLEPTPTPREPTPPPREPTPPPREPTPPPREPTPPPREPKPKKEVRILETPVPPPAKPKTVPQNPERTTKSCLAKKPEIPKETKPRPKPPPSEPAPKEAEEVATQVEEPPAEMEPKEAKEEVPEDDSTKPDDVQEEPEETLPEQTSDSEESAAHKDDRPEKKKLGPPPKYKVDLMAVDSQDLLDMEMKMRRKGPGSHVSDSDSVPPDIPEHLLRRKQPWQAGRLALSRRACRFEIPMDVHLLETMSPTEYLQKYCIISKRRQAMYRRAFSKADRNNSMKINRKEFNSAVVEALVDTVNTIQIQDVLELIEADDFTHFGPKLFCAICALLERLHYRDYVTEDTIDQENLVAKERVEDADFLALDWKFEGCVINSSLKRLLYML
ncbi:proteoglycan 4-like isoform X2 [Patiria miniata]|uniref:EF-hand domain-containing protein n=1 Tax=Patiria miniata TaxID=46514 RepID=A0A914A7I2_PATMI|nr:proteoglycan 4-like isoform X2 [Patiria miniata]